MDLYDKQTMKNGGITAPGRFKNPEGNWVSVYANGGDISIPDLSRPTWLNKYQDGGANNKSFRRSVDSKYTEGIQKMLNKTYGTGLSIDGVWGPLTEKAYQNHLEINNLQNQINKLDAKQQAFKNQDASLRKVDNTAKKSSTSVVVPKVENAKKQVESVQREAARVKSKMQETGAKSEAEVYAREKEMAAAQAKLTNQPVLKPAEDKSAGDYLSHAWDIASNPVTAFGYKARGEEIPWGFSQANRNPLEYATDVINPAFYANAAGRLADAATTGSTYTKTIPQALGATAGLLMNEEVPEEWNDEAIKTLGIIGDATVVSQGLKAVSEVGTAMRNAKSSNFINVKQEHTFPGLSNPKVAGNLSLKYNTPLPDHHFKDSGEFLDWYKKTQNNRPFTKKEINFLNKELKERGILEVQRSHPLNPLPNLTRRMLVPEDYNWENVINNAVPNLIKSTKGLDNLYKDYVMGPGRLNAFNQWLGLPTKGTMYRVHPESFQNGKGLLYTTTGNSMKGIFDPELKRLAPKSEFTRPVGKETFDELDIAIKAANKQPYQKQLEDMGYSDLASFTDKTGVTVSRRPNTVIDWDKYTGSAGGASWVRVPIKGGGYEWTMRDTWDIQPFSRMSRLPNFVRDADVANLIGAKNFDVNWNYRTSPKFNKISNMYYPGKGWTVKKYGGWLDEYQDGSEVTPGMWPSGQKRSDYVPYKDVTGSPYETQDPYINNYSTVDTPENLSELPSYRLYTMGKGSYKPFSPDWNSGLNLNDMGYVKFDPKTGYNYQPNRNNLQDYQSLPMEGEKEFNLRRFVLNPYEGQPQTHDAYIKNDGTVDKENFIPTSYSREETMDNVFKDLYGQNLYKFKGDRDAAYNATSEFMKERVEPQYKGAYYDYMTNPNVSAEDKLNINLKGSHMTVNPEQTEDYVRQTITNKLIEEHPEYMEKDESGNYKMSDDDFSNLVKADPRYKEKLNEYNNILQDWYVTNKNMSQEEAKGLVEKDLYKNVPKRKTTYATFKHGGWLEKYQEGNQVEANIPGYNPEVGPTIKNAQLLQELQMQEAVRNSRQLPSGAIQSTLGPIEYAMLPTLAAPAIRTAMAPNTPVPDKPKDIPSHLIGHSSPYYGNPKNPTPNKFLYPEQKGWVIGDMKPGRVSKPNPMDYLPRTKKKDGGESQGKGYYDYIGGYSIFANGGVSSKQSSWLNKYK
jgi:hypothetical protein